MKLPTSEVDYRIAFMDVCQGQASLAMDMVRKRAVIVDCAPGSAKEILSDVRDHILDVEHIFITHLDWDHCGDLMQIVEGTNPDAVCVNWDTSWKKDKQHPKLRSLLRGLTEWDASRRPTRLRGATATEWEFTPVAGRIRCRVLAPEHADIGGAHLAGRRNIASMVLRLNVGALRVLYCGDAEAEVLARLLGERASDLGADVVVAPHHGGLLHDSQGVLSLEDLYGAIGATIAIISAGARNMYGHPRPEAIRTVQRGSYSRVMCTEVTPWCLGAGSVDEHSMAAKDPSHQAAPPAKPACAGTIRIEVMQDGQWFVSPDIAAHQEIISGWRNPICATGDRLPIATP